MHLFCAIFLYFCRQNLRHITIEPFDWLVQYWPKHPRHFLRINLTPNTWSTEQNASKSMSYQGHKSKIVWHVFWNFVILLSSSFRLLAYVLHFFLQISDQCLPHSRSSLQMRVQIIYKIVEKISSKHFSSQDGEMARFQTVSCWNNFRCKSWAFIWVF